MFIRDKGGRERSWKIHEPVYIQVHGGGKIHCLDYLTSSRAGSCNTLSPAPFQRPHWNKKWGVLSEWNFHWRTNKVCSFLPLRLTLSLLPHSVCVCGGGGVGGCVRVCVWRARTCWFNFVLCTCGVRVCVSVWVRAACVSVSVVCGRGGMVEHGGGGGEAQRRGGLVMHARSPWQGFTIAVMYVLQRYLFTHS